MEISKKDKGFGSFALVALLVIGLGLETACSKSVGQYVDLGLSVGATIAGQLVSQGVVGGPAGVAFEGALAATSVLLNDIQAGHAATSDVADIATQLRGSIAQLQASKGALDPKTAANVDLFISDLENALNALPQTSTAVQAHHVAARAGIVGGPAEVSFSHGPVQALAVHKAESKLNAIRATLANAQAKERVLHRK